MGDGPNPQAVLAMILNNERRWNGLAPAVGNPGLQAQAELAAVRMSITGRLEHMTDGEFGWWLQRLGWMGEIIGYGEASEPGLLAVDKAWIRSPPHQAIMLDGRARLVGVGVREAGGRYWTSAVFGG